MTQTQKLLNMSGLKATSKISPQIIHDSLVEINANGSIHTMFSDKEIFLILKYFNDVLGDTNSPQIPLTRLKDMNIYKPLWYDSYVAINSSNVYLISEEMAALMKRCFKQNPFETISTEDFKIPSLKSTELFSDAPVSSFKFLVKHKELHKFYAHLGVYDLNDLDFFSNLCIPLFFDLTAKTQYILIEYLSEEILGKKYAHQKDSYLDILRKNLVIHTKRPNEPGLGNAQKIINKCKCIFISINNANSMPTFV